MQNSERCCISCRSPAIVGAWSLRLKTLYYCEKCSQFPFSGQLPLHLIAGFPDLALPQAPGDIGDKKQSALRYLRFIDQEEQRLAELEQQWKTRLNDCIQAIIKQGTAVSEAFQEVRDRLSWLRERVEEAVLASTLQNYSPSHEIVQLIQQIGINPVLLFQQYVPTLTAKSINELAMRSISVERPFLDELSAEDDSCIHLLTSNTLTKFSVEDATPVSTWLLPQSSNALKVGTAYCYSSGNLLLTGGLGSNDCSLIPIPSCGSHCEVFPLQPMQKKRAFHGLLPFQGWVYVFGGRDGGCALKTCEKLSLRESVVAGKWQRVADMPHARSEFNPSAFRGQLYCCGGQVAEIDVYVPADDSFFCFPHALPWVNSPTVTVRFKDELYVLTATVTVKLSDNECKQVCRRDPSLKLFCPRTPVVLHEDRAYVIFREELKLFALPNGTEIVIESYDRLANFS